MKFKRHDHILNLISKNIITTQEQLLEELKNLGYDVTQATVSRDIKELRLIKIQSNNGVYKYTKPINSATINIISKFKILLNNSVISVKRGKNIISINCHSGMAQAICATLDLMEYQEVLGTLAGDDSIFLLFETDELAAEYEVKLNDIINNFKEQR